MYQSKIVKIHQSKTVKIHQSTIVLVTKPSILLGVGNRDFSILKSSF